MSLSFVNTRLLSCHVSAISKLEKAKYVESYLQQQAIHARTYASEGRALSLSWNRKDQQENTKGGVGERPDAHVLSDSLVANYGLGTPVLKPRVMKRPITIVESPPRKKGTAEDPNVNEHQRQGYRQDHTGGGAHSGSCVVVANEGESEHQRKAPRRHRTGPEHDSQDGHTKRLKDRRDRKRAKKAIIKGATDHAGKRDATPNKVPRKCKREADGKVRISAGLALMHGFSATNVGKGRLTMKPPLSIGVFNKGKASAKTPVAKSSTAGHHSVKFTEEKFLGRTQSSNQLKRSRSPSSSSGSDIQPSKLEKPPENKRKVASTSQRKREEPKPQEALRADVGNLKAPGVKARNSKDPRESPSSPQSGAVTCLEIRAESIVWDIELDGVSLRSEPISTSQDGQRSQTVLLDDIHRLSWVCRSEPRNKEQGQTVRGDLNGSVSIDHPEPPSPSIGPSESASQLGLFAPDPIQGAVRSKYFIQSGVVQDHPLVYSERISPSIASLKSVRMSNIGSVAWRSCDNSRAASHVSEAFTSSLGPLLDENNDLQRPSLSEQYFNELGCLPDVDPKDYEYSDNDLHRRSLEGIGSQNAHNTGHEQGEYILEDVYKSGDVQSSDFLWQELESKKEHHELYGLVSAEEDQFKGNCINNDGFHDLRECGGNQCYDSELAMMSIHSSLQGSPESTDGSDLCNTVSDLNGSESSVENKDLAVLPAQFTQGRALLFGFPEESLWASSKSSRMLPLSLPKAEEDVAKKLKGHWFPQIL